MKMKMNKKTIDLLKYFSTINSNLLMTEGSQLKTRSVARNIFSVATIDEIIPQEFGFYNINEFISAMSLFKEAELTFEDKIVKIKEAGGSGIVLKYLGSKKENLVYPEQDIREPSYDVEFDMSQEQLQNIIKAANVISAPDFQVIGNDSGVCIKVCDRKNQSSNDYQVTISDVVCAQDFEFNLKVENLKVFPGNYAVSISGKGLAKFKNKDVSITTYIALESK